MEKTNNVFISHYGKDDEHVQRLKGLLKKNGRVLRNSSIDSTKPNNAKNENYIKGLLSDGITWAGTTVVLIGPETHTRWWVDWEIERSFKEGNRIVGVYINGGSDSDVPENFQKYGDALVGWDTGRIEGAIDGSINNWENSSGEDRDPHWPSDKHIC
ncbi:TIR domain-containing protein [Puteibacter caeruleilacunae]|nr:TIR domain-containing protein [Puteibacter caeruleilacunae]